MSKVLVIVGSTRPARSADLVVPWVTSRARTHQGFDIEVADLRDWPLPMFAEHMGTIGDLSDPTYSQPIVQAWNKKVKQADAFIVVTPEYNHSLPGVLKNAIDTVWLSFGFRNKPVAAVGYSGSIGGGIRAIEHLAQVVIEADAVPLRSAVVIPFVRTAFGADGEPVNPETDIRLQVMLDDLAWWSSALEKARAEGELPPGSFRARAALAAAQASRSTKERVMSFDTTAGTRGARQPAGFVFRWGNKLMASRIRRNGGGTTCTDPDGAWRQRRPSSDGGGQSPGSSASRRT